jgi:hypothetical protein
VQGSASSAAGHLTGVPHITPAAVDTGRRSGRLDRRLLSAGGLRPRTVALESFRGGCLDVRRSAGEAVQLAVRLPRLSLGGRALLIVYGPGAGQQPGTFAGEQDQGRRDTIAGGALVGDAACR